MSKYFVKFASHCQCKNNADKSAYQHIRTLDGTLLPDRTAKDDFLKEARRQIDLINRANTRCRDVKFYVYSGDKGDINVAIGESICYLHIYEVKNEIDSRP